MNLYFIFITIFILFLVIGFLLLGIVAFQKNKTFSLQSKKKDPAVCILIPARDESLVIASLLKSISNQTYSVSMKDVYVIVEDFMDPSVEIAKSFGCSYFVRQDLHLKRKGYALNEAIQALNLYQKSYDLYFVFDADNILENSFLEKMISYYQMGYPIAVGKRKNKNPLSSKLSDVSVLTFRLIDEINKMRIKQHMEVLVSGSGFYFTKELMKQWKGFPFHSLTEDYELSSYAILHHIPSIQVFDAIVYDEQPDSYVASKNQRVRWIRGFLDNQKEYRLQFLKKMKEDHEFSGSRFCELLGILPYLFLVVGVFGMLFTSLGFFLVSCFQVICWDYFFHFLFYFAFIFTFLFFMGVYLLNKDQPSFSWYQKLTITCYFPFFLISYIPCFISALLHKKLEWKKIQHQFHSNEI